MQIEGLEQLLNALKRIALNTSGDHSAQVIAGEAISEFEKKQAVQHSNNANAVKENGCNFPLCQDKQYQQDLAEQLHRDLYDDPQFEPVAWQFYQNGKWWNGDQHNINHRKNTEAAGIPTRNLYAEVSTNSACYECNSTGMRDSGGVHPWGEAIMVPCECQKSSAHPENQDDSQLAWLVNWLTKVNLLQHLVCQPEAGAPALPYWILRSPQMIDGSSVVGYGKTPEEAIAAASSIASHTSKTNDNAIDKFRNVSTMALEFLEFNGEHVANCEVFDLDEHGAHKNCTCGLEATLKALRSAVRTGNTTLN